MIAMKLLNDEKNNRDSFIPDCIIPIVQLLFASECRSNRKRSVSKESKPNQHNWIDTYDFDVRNSSGFSADFISKVAQAKLYNSPFFPPKKFDRNTAQRLAKIVSDSSSYVWGETTVEYNRNLIFSDSTDHVIAITKIDSENEWLNNAPFQRAMKWGKSSKKGHSDFFAEVE